MTRVFHAGDGVAAVAAVTEQIAAEALEKIKVEYEPLPPVLDPLESLKLRDARVHAPEQQHLRAQGDQEGRRRKGLRRVRPDLRGHASARRWSSTCRSSRTRPSPTGTPTAASPSTRRSAASRSAAPTSRARCGIPMSRIRIVATIVGGNFGGKNEITTGAGAGAAVEEDRPAGEVRVHARRGVHRVHDAPPAHHGLQDRRHQGRQDPRAQDSPGPRRRRLLLVERDDARQGLHPVAPARTTSTTSTPKRSSSTPTRP